MSNKIVYGSMDDLRCELEHAQQDCVFLYKKNQDLERQLAEALKLADEAIQHYSDSSNYSDQFFYDVSVMLGDSLKEQLKEQS